MTLEEILKQVDEIENIAAEGNFSAAALFPLGFSKVMRALVERVQEAEEVIHDTLGWADSNPLAIKFGKAYFEKWGSK